MISSAVALLNRGSPPQARAVGDCRDDGGKPADSRAETGARAVFVPWYDAAEATGRAVVQLAVLSNAAAQQASTALTAGRRLRGMVG